MAGNFLQYLRQVINFIITNVEEQILVTVVGTVEKVLYSTFIRTKLLTCKRQKYQLLERWTDNQLKVDKNVVPQ